MGLSAFFFSGFKTPEILSENVSALTGAYCVSDPGSTCYIRWLDGDSWISYNFSKVGYDEVEMKYIMDYNPDRRLWDFYNNSH